MLIFGTYVSLSVVFIVTDSKYERMRYLYCVCVCVCVCEEKDIFSIDTP